MILITGARGFIGSNLVLKLNELGLTDLILVDELQNTLKDINLSNAKYKLLVDREKWWDIASSQSIDFVFHIGARTDTTEFDTTIFDHLNVEYSQKIWNYCVEYKIPLIYASSAATYGNGELGYSDEMDIQSLKPLNPYGWSKQNFDLWVLSQEQQPPFWAGLKFFNVYGPQETHKGRMASVIFHAYHQIMKEGSMKLFKSHRSDYEDGGQLRDFIYVKDILKIALFLFKNQPKSGIYNCGTGRARTFIDLANATFNALGLTPQINFIDTPIDIRDKYQYFTQATTEKLGSVGFDNQYHSLEDGVSDYIQNYLSKAKEN